MTRTRIFTATAAGLLLAACAENSPTGLQPSATSVPRLNAGTGGVSGAAFTSVNEAADGTGNCKNGNPNVNCNQYTGKKFVWLNGGPAAAGLESGTYFWVVLQPGGQPTVLDGTAKNLSDDTDPYTNRTFEWVKGQGITEYLGSHDKDLAANKIRVGVAPAVVSGGPDWFADTPNNGGVYILAICSLKDGYDKVTPRDCKYDAFKVADKDDSRQEAEAPTVIKDADGAYKNTYTWGITKKADKTYVQQTSGSTTFTYTIVATRSGPVISDVKVTGTINVFNGNAADITGVTLKDELSVASSCKIDGQGSPVEGLTLKPGANEYKYECPLSAVPTSAIDNVATITWAGQPVAGKELKPGSANWTVAGIEFKGDDFDESVTVTDVWNGGSEEVLGVAPPFDPLSSNTATFISKKTVNIVANVCNKYDNTATFTTNDSKTTGSADETVTVCGPIANGFTLGFWSNNNGRNVLCSNDAAWRHLMNGGSTANPYLRRANTSFYTVPIVDNKGAVSCANAHGNFSSWLLAANGTNMQNMLSAQLAATTLNVSYRNMLGTALVKHPLTGAPATISSIIAEAVTFLRDNANTTAAGTLRNQATAYKDLFDALNNNKVFAVPAT